MLDSQQPHRQPDTSGAGYHELRYRLAIHILLIMVGVENIAPFSVASTVNGRATPGAGILLLAARAASLAGAESIVSAAIARAPPAQV
jgi:hypothetical protein